MNFSYSGSFANTKPYRKTLENFLGLDNYNTSLNVSEQRAVEMSNLEFRDGANQKRFGWEEKCSKYISYVGQQINGVWSFKDSSNNIHTIVHANNRIYRVNLETNTWVDITSTNTYNPISYEAEPVADRMNRISSNITNNKSFGIVRGNRLYIFCGIYLVYGSWNNGTSWELRLVEDDEFTYIPTTTIGISYNGSPTNVRTSMDEINMLCSKRRNKLIGANYTGTNLVYQLDSPISLVGLISVEKLKLDGTYEVIANYTTDRNNGTITFTGGNNAPLIEGQSNIRVTFISGTLNSVDKINKCTFGTFFGYNNVQHLFVSGNPDYPNMDWHTCERDNSESNSPLSEYEDLTYFGDLSYASLGSPLSKITGYTLLSDNALAVHKEFSPNEPSLYIRQSFVNDVVNISGEKVLDQDGNPYQKVYYSQLASAIGEGCITNDLNLNLVGDNLMLSSNGLYGLVFSDNIKSNERYARERSRLINNKLLKENDLQNATGIVFNNKLYLCVNSHIYLADARFKNQLKGEMGDTFSYEWWYWDNIPARIFFIYNNELWFGTSDGRICKFIKNSFQDIQYNICPSGMALGSAINKNITFDEDELSANDEVRIESIKEYVYESNSDNDISQDTPYIEITFNQYLLLRYFDGNTKLKYYNYSNVLVGDSNTYPLSVTDGNGINDYRITFGNITTRINIAYIVCEHSNETFKIMKQDDDDKYFLESRLSSGEYDSDGNEIYEHLNIKELSNSDNIIKKVVKTNVKGFWLTPIIPFSNPEYCKSIQNISVVFEPVQNGSVTLGYISSKTQYGNIDNNFITEGVDVYNFLENYSFRRVSFLLNSQYKVYTKKIKLKNVNFIQMYYLSDNDKNCVINSLSTTYTLSKLNKGIN